jgi:hypothetical protein
MNSVNPVQAGAFVQAIRGPIMLITLGTLVEIDYLGIYGFWRTWPLLIIVFGLLKLLEHAGAKPPASFPGGPSGSFPGGPSGSYPGEHPADRPPGGNVI